MPMMLVTTGTAIMSADVRVEQRKVRACLTGARPRSASPNSALLKTSAISSGFTTPRPDVTTIAIADQPPPCRGTA